MCFSTVGGRESSRSSKSGSKSRTNTSTGSRNKRAVKNKRKSNKQQKPHKQQVVQTEAVTKEKSTHKISKSIKRSTESSTNNKKQQQQQEKAAAKRPEGPNGEGPEGWGPKISRFFSSSRLKLHSLCSLSLGVFSWNLWCLKSWGPPKCTFGVLWVIVCEPRRPGLVGPPGFHTMTQGAQTLAGEHAFPEHFVRPRRHFVLPSVAVPTLKIVNVADLWPGTVLRALSKMVERSPDSIQMGCVTGSSRDGSVRACAMS